MTRARVAGPTLSPSKVDCSRAPQWASATPRRVRAAGDTGGGTSDGRFIAPLGAQVVEVGPVNASIHKIDEHVRIDDLARLRRIHRGIIDRLLG